MAIVDCPSCHKVIQVPENKLGRWIACPVCRMEFAALTEEADAEVEPSLHPPLEEYPRRRNLPSARIVIPVSLVFFVLLIGGIVYATARHTAKQGAPGEGAAVTVAPGSMPPIDRRNNQDGGFDIFSMQQPGGADSILGIGSTIQSIIYWTTVLSIVFVISSIGMLVWVARDSRNRGMESASWITTILLTNFVAFLVYLLSRPRGKLVHCRHCNNRCLEFAGTCPHCRRSKPVRKTRRKFED